MALGKCILVISSAKRVFSFEAFQDVGKAVALSSEYCKELHAGNLQGHVISLSSAYAGTYPELRRLA